MALDESETATVLEAVERSGRLFQVGQCLRFWPAYVELKRIIDSGEAGPVRAASFTRLSNQPSWTWEDWILDGAKSGDAALDLHVHDVDMIRWLFGEPDAVRSAGVPGSGGSFSHIETSYRFASAIPVSATGGWICADSFGFRMQALVILEGATVELDSSREHMLMRYDGDRDPAAVKLEAGDGFYHELSSFVSGVSSGRLSDRLTPADAAESVRVCRAEVESARTGSEVTL
jgi:predicted dehydrogenase